MKDSFDRDFSRISKIIVAVWIFGGLMSVAVLGVLLWAVVTLVQHFTA